MALFTALGMALGATTAASAAGIGAFGVGVAAATAGAAAIGSGVYSATQANKKVSVPALPKTPSVTASAAQAQAETKRLRSAMSRSETVFTSPLGIGGQAEVARKSLLGQ